MREKQKSAKIPPLLLTAGLISLLSVFLGSVSLAQVNTAGNVSVPLEGEEGALAAPSGPTMIVAIYRGPGYFSESRMGTLGSSDKTKISPTTNTTAPASSSANNADQELNPDYTPPPAALPLEDRLSLPDPPEIQTDQSTPTVPQTPITPPEDLQVEEISMPTLPSAPDAPLPPPPSLESLTPEPSIPSTAPPVAITPPQLPPPSVSDPESQDPELPSLSLPPPPSLDSIPPFEVE